MSSHTLKGLAISDRDAGSLAQRILRDTVPAELFVTVVELLQAAQWELDALNELRVPLPGEIVEGLREREAFIAALNRCPEEWKPRLRELYKEDLEAAFCDEEEIPGPDVDAGVLRALEDVWELLRRAALTQPGVDAALRQAVIRE